MANDRVTTVGMVVEAAPEQSAYATTVGMVVETEPAGSAVITTVGMVVEVGPVEAQYSGAAVVRIGPVPFWRRSRIRIVAAPTSTGPVITVPYDLPGLVAWYKADAGTFQNSNGTTPAVANTDPVGFWGDQVTAMNAIQATAGNRPTLATNAKNSKPAILFTAANQQRLNTAELLSGATKFSIYVVQACSADSMLIAAQNAYAGQIRIRQSDGNTISAYDASSNNPISNVLGVAKGDWSLVEYIFDTNAISFFQNGIAYGGGTYAGSTVYNCIGALPSGSNYTAGYMAEILVYSVAHDAATRQAIEAYMNGRWDLW